MHIMEHIYFKCIKISKNLSVMHHLSVNQLKITSPKCMDHLGYDQKTRNALYDIE